MFYFWEVPFYNSYPLYHHAKGAKLFIGRFY